METLKVDRSEGVVTVTLNRPEKKNAINGRMWEELASVFADVHAGTTDRVLVITGAGGDFCSGADLTGGGGDPQEHPVVRMRAVNDVALALHRLVVPTVARVDGVAVGAGCNLALGCDLIVATERSRFSEIFVRRGLSLDFGGSWLLPRLVGMHKAKELALLGDILSARDALEMGLVNKVVASEAALDEVVADWSARLAAGPPLALAANKRLLGESLQRTMDQALEAEGLAQAANLSSADGIEARAAFRDKRTPVFTGRMSAPG
ncbi:MAG: enoyl-CoA hydratase/isomerase family protein [Mycobacteriales bacterium]